VISSKRIKCWLVWSLLAMIFSYSANGMAIGGSIIEKVTVSGIGGLAQIDILFSCPHRYVDYNPQGATDYLQINLQSPGQCDFLDSTETREEVDTPADSELAALDSMEYESQPGDDAVLYIRFDYAVRIMVSQSKDQRQLRLTIETYSMNATPLGPGAALGDRPLSEARLVALMGEGESAFLQEYYSRSIQVYTRVLQAEESTHSPKALELLGLSRERKGQIAHAVAEYQRYLEHYPDREGADRVSQRLSGLVTAHKSPNMERQANAAKKGRNPWDVHGGISQYYRRDTFTLEGQKSINAQSSILTNADLVLRRRGERFDLSGRATVGHLWDLLGEDKGPGNQTRLYQGYLDVADQVTGLSGRFGRQTLRTNGVLGRFDGVHLGWEFSPGKRFNLMGGYPVVTTANGIENDRHFLGAAIDFEQLADLFDVSFFYNQQKLDGLENREAIGGEFRYFDRSKSLIALVDYDIGFKTLNSLVIQGNWNFSNGFTLSSSVDHRTSPFLTTRNALIGQPVTSLEELLLIRSADEIRQIAKDRTGTASAFRLGASQTLSERFQLTADFTMTEFDGTIASEGVAEIPDQETQYYYSLNLIGSRLFMDGDSHIIGLRHIDSGTTTTSTLSLDSRFPVSRKFRINPRLRVSHRDYKLAESTSLILFPSLRLLYRIGRHYRLDFEVGGQWVNRDSIDDTGDRRSWFLYLGYRADF
jgi:tetratricopeptide (TPR) repeat protein